MKKSVDQQLLEAKAAALPPDMVKKYRSLVMRAAYLSQDRADLGHAVKTLSRKKHHRHDSFLRKTSDKTRQQCTVHHRFVDRGI